MSQSKRRKRRKSRFSRRTQPGSQPGVVRVDPEASCPQVCLMAFGDGGLIEQKITDLDTIPAFLAKWPMVWINVEGLGDAETINKLGAIFHLHPLALEDVVNVHQRPKVEPYEGYLFCVARMIELNDRLETEQVSIFLGPKWIVTFLEDPGDAFDPVRRRLRENRGRIRSSGASYLAYALLDAVVDAYFPVVEMYGERLDELEDQVVSQPDRSTIAHAHQVKRDLRSLRRAIWPLREAINQLTRDDSGLVDPETRVFLRDCYDHTVQIIDLVETYRELDADLTDLYLSSLSNRLNEVMKVLTVIATIFMPMTFIAGVYGMNFNTEYPWNMPELNWPFGYMFSLVLMALSAAGMVGFFRWMGWVRWPALPVGDKKDEESRNP